MMGIALREHSFADIIGHWRDEQEDPPVACAGCHRTYRNPMHRCAPDFHIVHGSAVVSYHRACVPRKPDGTLDHDAVDATRGVRQ